MAARPRLTVGVLTHNSEKRLAQFLHDVGSFADQIVVGVDAASTDRTLEIALKLSDVVFLFAHTGQLAGARLQILEYADGDWFLSLDDDEMVEEGFDSLLSELMTNPLVTHYYLPRKWVANLNPCEYRHGHPWLPNWALRLFRNDRRLVWKPPKPHTGYRVIGPCAWESRMSILHFEPILIDDAERLRKVEAYRQAGSNGEAEDYYAPVRNEPSQRPARLRPSASPRAKRETAELHSAIRMHSASATPPWGSTIIEIDMPSSARPGEILVALVTVQNRGKLAWIPPSARWPTLQLGYHLLGSDGGMIVLDGGRTPVPRFVYPDDVVTFICHVTAPTFAGNFLLEWDMVSENECWFRECGGTVRRSPLKVDG